MRTIRLMTNNPAKYHGLKGFGLTVVGRVPLFAPITLDNKRYIETKRKKMGHMFGNESDEFNAVPVEEEATEDVPEEGVPVSR